MTGANPDSIVRTYYELVDAERYDDLVALFADDVRYERPGQQAIEGKPALRTFYEKERPLEDGSHEIYTVVVAGDTVAVRGTFSGRQAGADVEFDFADFHEFEDGEIARRYTFTDRDEI